MAPWLHNVSLDDLDAFTVLAGLFAVLRGQPLHLEKKPTTLGGFGCLYKIINETFAQVPFVFPFKSTPKRAPETHLAPDCSRAGLAGHCPTLGNIELDL